MTNRFTTICAAALLLPVAFTSCNDDNDLPPVIEMTEVSDGVVVINQGSYYANIPGTLTYVDFATNTASQKAFSAANDGSVLGDTPQDAIVYGQKMYIAVYESNLIRVVDRKTLSLIRDIKPDGSATPGMQPRYFAADGEKVYVTMYNGYVSRIDTTQLAIDACVKVGPNPDGIAVFNNRLYVANSDGLNYLNAYADGKTVSEIDIPTFSELRKINVGLNPGPIAANENGVYVIARGNYTTIPSTLQSIASDGSVTDIAPATHMSATHSSLYYINSPIASPAVTAICKLTSAGTTTFAIDPIEAPAAIGAEPVSGNIFITAYSMGDSGYADYYAPGYMNRYDANGAFTAKYQVGLNPCAITFNNALSFDAN